MVRTVLLRVWQQYEAKIAALERLGGLLELELEVRGSEKAQRHRDVCVQLSVPTPW